MATRLHECGCGCNACQNESSNMSYMFFGNLQAIKRNIDALLEMDPMKVDSILNNGHDWAKDHMSSAADDIQEVTQFLLNNFEENTESQFAVKTYESFIRARKK